MKDPPGLLPLMVCIHKFLDLSLMVVIVSISALNQLQSVPQLQPGCSPAPTQSTPSLTSKPQPLGTSSAPDVS